MASGLKLLSLRDFLALFAGKLISKILKILGFNASSAPAFFAEKFSSGVSKRAIKFFLERNNSKLVLVTGTNGKSTSTGFLANILKQDKTQDFIYNSSGANLLTGILTSIINSSSFNIFKLKINNKFSTALFEIDEAFLKKLTEIYPADFILVNNFFRDQLDRFGELENTIKLVSDGLIFKNNLNNKFNLILNSDDPNVSRLGINSNNNLNNKNNILYFGLDSNNKINNLNNNLEIFSEEQASCPVCGASLKYNSQWLGQFGDYFCSECSYKKPDKNTESLIQACDINLKINSTSLRIKIENKFLDLEIPLAGLFNLYNCLAAVSCAHAMGISPENIKSGIESYKSLFGRSQQVKYRNKIINLFLIKNPIGASEVLRLISRDSQARVMIIINDNYADGRDVSWLWDAHFEYLNNNSNNNLLNTVFVSGSRASDMAVRLKYAGIESIFYEPKIKKCLENFIDSENINNTENNINYYILPTYTALLELTKILNIKY